MIECTRVRKTERQRRKTETDRKREREKERERERAIRKEREKARAKKMCSINIFSVLLCSLLVQSYLPIFFARKSETMEWKYL